MARCASCSGPISTLDSFCVELVGDGSVDDPLIAAPRLDPTGGLTCGAAGLAVGGTTPATSVPVYIWDGISDYELSTGRIFIGPNDPAGEGFTVADGDIWEQTS